MNQPADNAPLIDQLARTIRRFGLRTPAIMALGAGHPATFLGSQFLWVAQPALALFVAPNTVRQTAELLEQPQAVQALLSKLEAEEA